MHKFEKFNGDVLHQHNRTKQWERDQNSTNPGKSSFVMTRIYGLVCFLSGRTYNKTATWNTKPKTKLGFQTPPDTFKQLKSETRSNNEHESRILDPAKTP